MKLLNKVNDTNMINEATDKNFVSDAEKTKLSGIAENANNYSHPVSHSPSIITQDANNRFVTDTEKSTWNAKADGDHTHTGVYEPADATILKDADIGSTVQGYNANTVVDASYVHTDNNYTTPEKNKLASIEAGGNVTSVAGRTGDVVLTKSDVGLANVENYGIATEAEAQAGTSNVKYMTPLTGKRSFDVSGGTLIVHTDVTNTNITLTSPSKRVSASVGMSGTVRVGFNLAEDGSGTAYGRIYVNGVAVGTLRSITSMSTPYTKYTEDIPVSAGNEVAIYCWVSATTSRVYSNLFEIGVATGHFVAKL